MFIGHFVSSFSILFERGRAPLAPTRGRINFLLIIYLVREKDFKQALRAHVGYLLAPWDVLWSLSVEEMFYFFFPLCCFFIKNQRHLVFILISFILVGPFARTLGSNASWQDYSYLSCMDGIAFGVLAALYSLKATQRFRMISTIVGAFLVLLIFIFRKLAFILGLTHWNIQVSLLEFGIALILIALSQYQGQPKGTAIIRWFGCNSYEIYLTHSIVIIGFMYFLKSSSYSVLLYLPVIVISGCVGYLIAKYFSEPLNIWIRRANLNKNSCIRL